MITEWFRWTPSFFDTLDKFRISFCLKNFISWQKCILPSERMIWFQWTKLLKRWLETKAQCSQLLSHRCSCPIFMTFAWLVSYNIHLSLPWLIFFRIWFFHDNYWINIWLWILQSGWAFFWWIKCFTLWLMLKFYLGLFRVSSYSSHKLLMNGPLSVSSGFFSS